MNEENYQQAVDTLRAEIPNLEIDPELVTMEAAREGVIQRYGGIFSTENVGKITEEDFHGFLEFKNNCHWTTLYRHKARLTKDMDALRAALSKLLDATLSLSERYDQADAIPGLGKNTITAILLMHSPQECGVWNQPSEQTLKELGVFPKVKGSQGEKYSAVNEVLVSLANELKVELWTLDALFWSFRLRKDNEGSKSYWWVNQKTTYVEQRAGGYLWAPLEGRRGRTFHHHTNVQKLKPGDLVLHYCSPEIRAVGRVVELPVQVPLPKELVGKKRRESDPAGWELEEGTMGTRCEIKYFDIDRDIQRSEIPAELIREERQRVKKNCVFNKDHNPMQGYLFETSPEFYEAFRGIFKEYWPKGVEESGGRLPVSDFDSVEADHVWSAVQKLIDGFEDHHFGPSTDYDIVLEDGTKLPPKAVFGLAASEALGFEVLPKHFSGGEGSICFRILRRSGFQVFPKEDSSGTPFVEPDLPSTSEDREWAEGKLQRVTHLSKERDSGVSRAKRVAFKREHGKLFCEHCKLDPVEEYGGEQGESCIEVHHTIPVAEMEPGHRTTLEELQCLCANCHRVEHRRMREDSVI